MNRNILFLLAAAGSVGVPMMTSGSDWESAFQSSETISAESGAEVTLTESEIAMMPGGAMTPVQGGGQLNGGQVGMTTSLNGQVVTTSRVLAGSTLTGPEYISFTELFRFDMTPDWIFQHWSRVSTVTEHPTLQGFRVPVVTGTQPFDLAGSLTYYFDKDSQAQRIVFHGSTGDARPLVQWITAQHELLPQETSQAGLQLYQRHWHGVPISELRVLPAPIVQQADTFAKYQVDLLLERPASATIFKPGETKGPSWRL